MCTAKYCYVVPTKPQLTVGVLYCTYIQGVDGVTMKEGTILFNDARNTFYLRLYDVRHMVND